MKKSWIIILLIVLSSEIHSQKIGDGTGKVNVQIHFAGSIGLERQKLSFISYRNNSTSFIRYSPGGGVGAELALQYVPHVNLALDAGFFYSSFFMKSQSERARNTYPSNSSAVSFKKEGIVFGGSYRIPIGDYKNNLQIGGGFKMTIPGQLEIIENSEYLGKITYYESIGWYIKAGADIYLGKKKKIAISPHLRYNNISFEPASYSEGNLVTLDEDLKYLKSNGIDILLGIKIEL